MNEKVLEPASRRVRRRVGIDPRFSQIKWVQLIESSKDLNMMDNRPHRQFSMEEVREHNDIRRDAFVVLCNRVYNITQYVPFHPGGIEVLTSFAGHDITTIFNETHPWVSIKILDKLCVGWLEPQTRPCDIDLSKQPQGQNIPVTYNHHDSTNDLKIKSDMAKAERRCFQCKIVSSSLDVDCRSCIFVRISFELDVPPVKMLSLLEEPGSNLKLFQKVKNRVIERFFTPFLKCKGSESTFCGARSSSIPEPTSVDLFIKVYKDSKFGIHFVNGKFDSPCWMEIVPGKYTLKVHNDRIEIKARGAAAFQKNTDSEFEHMCLISSGTGIMPLLQMHDFVAQHSSDVRVPTVSMICANRSKKDVPFKTLLQDIMSQSSAVLKKVTHVFSDPESAEKEGTYSGHIDSNIVQTHLSEVSLVSPINNRATGIRFLICGSCDFNSAIERSLLKQGFSGACIFRVD